MSTVFTTHRLFIRQANLEDTDLFVALWNEPRVMKYVGFPQGLKMSHEQMQAILADQPDTPYNRLLVVIRQEDGQAIGECKLGLPNDEGIAETDVKLLPVYWGNQYGVEIKRGLLDYLFTHTNCLAVDASPNVDNLASIKMQEAVGGQRIGEDVYEFPEHMRAFTTSVHCYIYRVTRAAWDANH